MEHMSYSFWIYVLLAGSFWRFFLQMCSVRYQPAAAEAKQRFKYVACSLCFFGNVAK